MRRDGHRGVMFIQSNLGWNELRHRDRNFYGKGSGEFMNTRALASCSRFTGATNARFRPHSMKVSETFARYSIGLTLAPTLHEMNVTQCSMFFF